MEDSLSQPPYRLMHLLGKVSRCILQDLSDKQELQVVIASLCHLVTIQVVADFFALSSKQLSCGTNLSDIITKLLSVFAQPLSLTHYPRPNSLAL